MTYFKFSAVRLVAARRLVVGGVAGVAAIAALLTALPVSAHHPFVGQAPQSMFEGLLSGIG